MPPQHRGSAIQTQHTHRGSAIQVPQQPPHRGSAFRTTLYSSHSPPLPSSVSATSHGDDHLSVASFTESVHEAFLSVSTPVQAYQSVIVSFEAKPTNNNSGATTASIGTPRTKTATVLKYTKGITDSWKERTMSVDSTNVGVCVFSENSGTINLARAHVEVMWAYEEKTGQKYQFSVTEATKEELKESNSTSATTAITSTSSPSTTTTTTNKSDKNKFVIRVGNLLEFDAWLNVLQSHGCSVNRPIRVGAMMLSKKKEESWFVLYSNSLQYFKQKQDKKATKIVMIGEGTVFEKLESENSFILSETGDDQALSLECTPPFNECMQWYECIETAVRQRLKKKFTTSIREGYLYKSAKNMKFWKKRYFVLMSDHMKYFKKRFDEQHAGIIQLPPGAEAEEEEHVGAADSSSSSTNMKNCMFWVAENGDESGTRRYHMTARNENEKDLWLQTLHTVFAKKNLQVVPLSLKEGYLYKASSKKNLENSSSWSKRYFVLLKDKLIYFKKRNDPQPKGLIDLCQGAEIVAMNTENNSNHNNNNNNKHKIFSIAENGDEDKTRIYYLYTKDAQVTGVSDWYEMINNLLKTKNPRVNEHSVQEGYMRKQGYTNKWHKRYFVLLEKNLLYYKKRGDKQEAGEIPLPGSAEVIRVESDDAENKWQFSVAENGDETGTRVYHMSAPSAELRTQWMLQLQKIIKAKDSRIMIGSFLEGYLWKCPKKGNVWRKRYFVLQQNQLLYFRKRTDETEAGCIEIKGEAEISVIDDDFDHPYAFTVAKNGDEGERLVKIYAADHMKRNEWVTALRQQTSLFAVKENPNSVREGYVYHYIANNTWKKRFFTLEKDPGCLSLFVKRKDTKPALKFVLDKETCVVWLCQEKIPFHSSVWGKHEQTSNNSNKQDLPGSPEEKLNEDSSTNNLDVGSVGGGEEEKEVSIVLCKTGDVDAKNIRLRGVFDMGESLVTEVMTVCLSKEFVGGGESIISSNNNSDRIIKSGYLFLRQIQKNSPFQKQTDKWINYYVCLTKDNLYYYKHSEEEIPLGMCTIDSETKFFTGAVSGLSSWNALCVTVVDKTDREICMYTQSKEEKMSWCSALTRLIDIWKDNSNSNNSAKPPSSSLLHCDIFGADLKNSFQYSIFYHMSSVIMLCVEYLKSVSFSVVLLPRPGFHPLVRSFIQDFETFQEVALTDADSVAACLRAYLVMLKKPLIPDATVKALLEVLGKVKKMAQNTVSNSEKFVIHQFQKIVSLLDTETFVALSTLLHYLAHELRRPNEPSLTLDSLLPVWTPLLIRYKAEEDNNNNSNSEFDHKAILSILIRNIDVLFPGGAPIGVRKLPSKKLELLRERCNHLSFDVLYKDKYGLELFRRFAKANYIEEEIKFLSATQQFREMCESASYSQTQCLAAALLICATYIKQGAETQVNVAATLSTAVLANFEDPKSPVRSRQLMGHEFAVVEAEAVLLITTNAYPRFKQSEGFDHWITHREALTQAGLAKVEEEGVSLLVQLKKLASGLQEAKTTPSTLSPSSSAHTTSSSSSPPPPPPTRSSFPPGRSSFPSELPVARLSSPPPFAPTPIVGYVDMTFDLVEGASDKPGPPSRARSIVAPGGASPVVAASVSASIAAAASSSVSASYASSSSVSNTFPLPLLMPSLTTDVSLDPQTIASSSLVSASPSSLTNISSTTADEADEITRSDPITNTSAPEETNPSNTPTDSNDASNVNLNSSDNVSNNSSRVRSMSFVAPPSSTSEPTKSDSISEEIWFKKKSLAKDAAYYINVTTKQTTWKMPEEGVIYSCMLDDEGREYFANIREKTSSWEVPECLKDFVEVYKLT